MDTLVVGKESSLFYELGAVLTFELRTQYVLGSKLPIIYFHIIGDGHQPNSRGLYTHYKDSLLKVG